MKNIFRFVKKILLDFFIFILKLNMSMFGY